MYRKGGMFINAYFNEIVEKLNINLQLVILKKNRNNKMLVKMTKPKTYMKTNIKKTCTHIHKYTCTETPTQTYTKNTYTHVRT